MIVKNKIIDGILLLDKPLHISSNGALQRVKRLFGARKAGHTGSLDPLATGMLPICFGKATKQSQRLLESDKFYLATIKFGEKTSTGDAEGHVIETQPTDHITLQSVQQALKKFTGLIQQIPPMYSALKHQGKPLYELARQGIEIERKPREVTIHSIELISHALPNQIIIAVHCTKGTYVRTLAEDISAALGSCGSLIGLRRTAVAPYQNHVMVTLPELEELCQQAGQEALMRHLMAI